MSYVYTYSCPDTGIVRYVGAGKAKRCYRWRSRGPSVVRQCERRTTSPLWISIAITPAAFEAIAVTLPLGSVGYEAQLDAQGQRPIWLEGTIVARLTAMRGPGESYSDVILRLVEMEDSRDFVIGWT